MRLQKSILAAALLFQFALAIRCGSAFGRCSYVTFDGAGDFIECNYSPVFDLTSLTIECWVKHATGSPLAWEDMVMKGNLSYGLHFYRDTQEFDFQLYTSRGRFYDLTSGVAPAAGVWYHVAGTFDEKTLTQNIYVNGILTASQAVRAADLPINTSIDPLTMGYEVAGDNNWLNGSVDEVRIWNHARSEKQIRNTMNVHLTGSEPGLVAYYPLDEGTGGTTYDATSNHNDGTLYQDAAWTDGYPACWVPDRLSTSNVTRTSAQLNWLTQPCAIGYRAQYRESGTSMWSNVKVSFNVGSVTIDDLAANTEYEWHVKSICDTGVGGRFSRLQSFVTAP